MRVIYIIVGTIFLGIGALGVVLPILPTTPFLLITAYCYAKGSKRFSDWFVSTRLYKRYLSDFVTHRSMTKRHKWTLMIVTDLIMLVPFLMTDSWWVKGMILVLDALKYLYFFTQVKTIPTKLSE
ncbi:MAG TPA: YbaN family protein [Bacilli bacterium]|nr:YbaN family protein [Bacilli bacterium]